MKTFEEYQIDEKKASDEIKKAARVLEALLKQKNKIEHEYNKQLKLLTKLQDKYNGFNDNTPLHI